MTAGSPAGRCPRRHGPPGGRPLAILPACTIPGTDEFRGQWQQPGPSRGNDAVQAMAWHLPMRPSFFSCARRFEHPVPAPDTYSVPPATTGRCRPARRPASCGHDCRTGCHRCRTGHGHRRVPGGRASAAGHGGRTGIAEEAGHGDIDHRDRRSLPLSPVRSPDENSRITSIHPASGVMRPILHGTDPCTGTGRDQICLVRLRRGRCPVILPAGSSESVPGGRPSTEPVHGRKWHRFGKTCRKAR